eukprot:14383-Heterococcus_DN1.PRE.2
MSVLHTTTHYRAAASTYAQLLNSQSDNNVKLIVLERLDTLKKRHAKVLQEVLMDILRALNSPNVDICRKTLTVAMDLVSPRNIHEVVQFPDVADSVIHVLMDFLNGEGAIDVILFVRAISEQYPPLRLSILGKLTSSIRDMTSSPVLCVALWVLGTYIDGADPIAQGINGKNKGKPDAPILPTYTTKNVVLSDGTYATQTVVVDPGANSANANGIDDKTCPIRRLICSGDVFLGSALGACLTKITLKAMQIHGATSKIVKDMQVRNDVLQVHLCLYFCA